MTCVTDSDFKAIAESGISQFNKAVEGIPFDSCALFRDEASRLEAGLLGVYRVVVSMVRREEDIELCPIMTNRSSTAEWSGSGIIRASAS